MLLTAYAQGYFPMARSEDDSELDWYYPQQRGIMPLDEKFHLSRSNKRLLRQHPYTLTLNKDFRAVMEQCRKERDGCWISDKIIELYSQTHDLGFAHSVECWENDSLMGGIYGIAIGGAFFGESMFSRATNASKVALVYLVERLNAGGYALLDTQFITDHLKTMGAIEISRSEYHALLKEALMVKASFHLAPP